MANDRVYHLPVEAVVSPTDQKAQLSQLPVEVVVSPTSQKAQLAQLVVEVIYPASNPTTPTATPRFWATIVG